jgi:hypothetical protein
MGWRSHYAVSHFPGLVAFRPGRWLSPIKNSTHPLVDFGSPTEFHPVSPSRPHRRSGTHGSLLGFRSLQRLPASGVHSARGRRTRYVPSPGFGYPLDGLLPPAPGRACFVPTAFLGFLPSELCPLTRWQLRFRSAAPACRQPATFSRGRSPGVGAADTGFRALALLRIPRSSKRC